MSEWEGERENFMAFCLFLLELYHYFLLLTAAWGFLQYRFPPYDGTLFNALDGNKNPRIISWQASHLLFFIISPHKFDLECRARDEINKELLGYYWGNLKAMKLYDMILSEASCLRNFRVLHWLQLELKRNCWILFKNLRCFEY